MSSNLAVEQIVFHDHEPEQSDFRADVLAGLRNDQKMIPPKYFYDHRGSELFDAICEQPEYYPTRTEIGILEDNAADIADQIGTDCVLIELGSGASKKIRLLCDALSPSRYLGVDISREFLLMSTRKLAKDYPWLEVHAVCADFTRPIDLPESPISGRQVAFFPGSSIGNFEPTQAVSFLRRVAEMVGVGGKLLIGVDLKKAKTVLDDAYNDAAGVTAEFNLNLLTRMRDELGAELDEEAFEHHAFYNESVGRIEMHLVSRRDQKIVVEDEIVEIQHEETIHTESSYKYSRDEFSRLAARAGFSVDHVWTDERELFSVQLCTVSG